MTVRDLSSTKSQMNGPTLRFGRIGKRRSARARANIRSGSDAAQSAASFNWRRASGAPCRPASSSQTSSMRLSSTFLPRCSSIRLSASAFGSTDTQSNNARAGSTVGIPHASSISSGRSRRRYNLSHFGAVRRQSTGTVASKIVGSGVIPVSHAAVRWLRTASGCHVTIAAHLASPVGSPTL